MSGPVVPAAGAELARSRLPTGDTFSVTLTAVSQGLAAAALLEHGVPEPAEGAVLLRLPQFGYTALGGKRYVNRIEWSDKRGRTRILDGPAIRVLPLGQAHRIAWTVRDSGAGDQSGALTVTPDGRVSGDLPDTATGIEPAAQAVFSRRQLTGRLERVAQEGRAATVEMVRQLTPYTTFAVRAAGTRVWREIADSTESRSVIDDLEAETIADLLLLGEEGGDSSIVTRLVRRVAVTSAVSRTSLPRYVALAIWSAAETKVRAHIGDPHAGRSIRRVARQVETTDPETVLKAYREAYPRSDVGLARVQAALTAGATVAAQAVTLDWVEGERGDRDRR